MAIKPAVWFLGGLTTLATAVGVWAQIPDSMLNKQIDQMRADKAHGRLVAVSDDRPLGNRYPIVTLMGMNNSNDADGPSAEELKFVVGGPLPDTAGAYQEWQPDHDFGQDTKVYGYWYNSDASPEEIAGWFNALVENHPELSQKKLRFSTWNHSMAGLPMKIYWEQTNNRRLDAKVTIGTPNDGALMADWQRTNQAIEAGYPKWVANIAKQKLVAKRKIDFDAPGVRWLTLNYPAVSELHQQHPFDDSWTLIAGVTKPSSGGVGGYLDILMLVDRIWLESSRDQDTKAYQISAYVLQAGGITGGSDGVVGAGSALNQSTIHSANTVILEDHNHSQVWWGNSGLDAVRARLRPVMPYIVAHLQPSDLPFANGFDIWLPSVPRIDLPKPQVADLTKAELVWVESGKLVVAEKGGANQVSLSLGSGFSWPHWSGDDIIATWHHDNQDDVVVVDATTGELVQLTDNGTSWLAGAQDDGPMIAFESSDLMIMDSSRGLARVLVQGPIKLTSPPVFVGNRLYFAISNNGRSEVRWVNPALNNRTIAQTAIVGSVATQPMKFGAAALGLKASGEVMVISPWWTGTVPLSKEIQSVTAELTRIGMPPISLVDFSSQWGDAYLVCGQNEICQLDLGLIAQSFGPNTPTVTGWEDVAKPIAIGAQLDVK